MKIFFIALFSMKTTKSVSNSSFDRTIRDHASSSMSSQLHFMMAEGRVAVLDLDQNIRCFLSQLSICIRIWNAQKTTTTTDSWWLHWGGTLIGSTDYNALIKSDRDNPEIFYIFQKFFWAFFDLLKKNLIHFTNLRMGASIYIRVWSQVISHHVKCGKKFQTSNNFRYH